MSSFAGGLYTIVGNNLSPSSYITVNSFVGKISSYSSTSVAYYIPPFVTQTSQNAFGLSKVSLLDSSGFTYFSDQPSNTTNVTAAFDSSITTIYGSANAVCWVGVDVGAGLQVVVDRFRFFLYFGWKNTASKILGATFEGSNDLSAWTTMAVVDQTAHSGWNVFRSISSTAFRYIRMRHST